MHISSVPESFFHALASAAADAALPHFRTGVAVSNKAEVGFDPVTAGDKGAELAMRALIERDYPDHGILGEEEDDVRPDAEDVWVLDPIDGTRAFISGIPLWGTLIGLRSGGIPVAGMMTQPFIGERFFGAAGAATYTGPLGNSVLKTRACPSLSDALLCTTSPYLFASGDVERYRSLEASVRMARYGTDCYAYCLLAAGHVDVVIESGLKPYDILALIPIIEAAGGRVTTWDGDSAAEGGRILATGDPRLHDEILRRLED